MAVLFRLILTALFVVEQTSGYSSTQTRYRCKIMSAKVVDCRHESLKSVPNDTFPASTEKLDLSYNHLTKIFSYTFRTMVNLVWLDLSYNRIHTLQKHAFVNLHRLEYLNINSNEIILSDETYPAKLFLPLQNLRVLHMEDNKCKKLTTESQFPTAVAALSNLTELYTDFPTYVSFTREFANLTKLEKISSSGNGLPNKKHKECCVRKVYNTTFVPFRGIGIKHFRLAYSCLLEIQLDVFKPFGDLESMELIGNQQLGLYWALQTLHGLQNKTISHLSFKSANSYDRRRKRDFLPNIYSTRYLSTICVDSLDMSINFILMSKSAPFSRPDCLRRLDMSVHITDPKLLVLKLIHDRPFPKLDFLNISISDFGPHGPLMENNLLENISLQELPIPRPKLNLHTVDVSYLPLRCDFYSPEFQRLTVVNISGWNCTIINPQLFLQLVNVTHFSARDVNLDAGLRRTFYKGSFIRNMLNLEEVDFSGNKLTSLPDDLFLTNHRLSSLNLYNNKLTGIPMQVFKTTKLLHLDLSGNVIEYLTASEIQGLDSQRQRSADFRVALASNPFVCNCHSLGFLQWLNSTDIVSDFGEDFTCRTTNGQLVEVPKFMENFKDFSVSCVSSVWLKVGIGSMFVVIVIIFAVLGYYRNRWNIHYWFYTNCRPTPDMLPVRQFNYDAFVCYNHNDYDWVHETLQPYLEHDERGLHLCLHHRDFEVGEVIQQNIVDAINNSRKVILVISNNFVRSTWGEYEIEMAGMRSVQEGRANVIISVLLEEVPVREMPRSLMNLWHRVTFLVWPQSLREQQLFWERLIDAIG